MSDVVRVGSLSGIVMRGPGLTATLPFYEDMWGLRLAHAEPGAAWLRGTGEEPFLYGLRDAPVFGIDHIEFRVESAEALAALHAQVSARAPAHGGAVLSAPAPMADHIGGTGCEILDPDNRRIRFRHDGLRLNEEPEWAKPRKVSHVVLNTPDMEARQRFFEEVLGFRVSDYSADQMVFLRCATDHHSIALVRGAYASVNHVAFEMPTLDEFMRGIGRMKQKGHHPTWGPGRHGPGNNPFAYFCSPSGFVIEFTSELQQIDEATHRAKVWSRDDPESMDRWMTAGPPTPAQRAIMQGRPDPGFPELRAQGAR